MAGFLGVKEMLVPSEGALKTLGAPLPPFSVLHDYGPEVRIARIETPDFEKRLEGALAKSGALANAGAPRPLSWAEQRGIAAFAARNSAQFKERKQSLPLRGAAWDHEGFQPPHTRPEPLVQATIAALGAAFKPTSLRLAGSVSVGLVWVSGPGNLAFTTQEMDHINTEAQEALTFLGTLTPQTVRWVYDIQDISITTPQTPPATFDYEGYEKIWRDPALGVMGCKPGLAGVYEYIEGLRKKNQTDWTFAAFFTKYDLHHFAYAGLGGPRVVMSHDNDGWGVDKIDLVFAHEVGHIFQAPDEYAASRCTCTEVYGIHRHPNENCQNCAPQGGVPCLMRDSDWKICDHTRKHLGL